MSYTIHKNGEQVATFHDQTSLKITAAEGDTFKDAGNGLVNWEKAGRSPRQVPMDQMTVKRLSRNFSQGFESIFKHQLGVTPDTDNIPA